MAFSKEQQVLLKYKWEFLRRNKDYIRDYSNFKKRKRHAKGAKGFFKKKYLSLLSNYGVYPPINPKLDFSEQVYENFANFNQIVFIRDDHRIDVDNLYSYIPSSERFLRFIELIIDLSAPNHRILKEVGDALRIIKDIRGIKFKSQLRQNEFKRYLQIYDLKERKKTWREIVEIVFSNQLKSNPNRHQLKPYIEKARVNYKACKKLIDGGYRFLR